MVLKWLYPITLIKLDSFSIEIDVVGWKDSLQTRASLNGPRACVCLQALLYCEKRKKITVLLNYTSCAECQNKGL